MKKIKSLRKVLCSDGKRRLATFNGSPSEIHVPAFVQVHRDGKYYTVQGFVYFTRELGYCFQASIDGKNYRHLENANAQLQTV